MVMVMHSKRILKLSNTLTLPGLTLTPVWQVHGVESHGKRKIWLLFSMVAWQPIVMLWLTYSLIPAQTILAATFQPPPPADVDMGL